jgi:beta-1,4-mannosyltransferase
MAGQRRAGRGASAFVVMSVLRTVAVGVRLLAVLMRLRRPDVILVQCPPAVPTLALTWLAARLRRARFVIDWHNLSHTVLALRLGDAHRAVRALARSERRWARRADGHLTVSKALAAYLARAYGVRATVVYDRPASMFQPVPRDAGRALWDRLAAEGALPGTRVPLVVCPTSWTADEDFDLLLEALERTERALAPPKLAQTDAASEGGPRFCVLVSGRGTLRDSFETRLSRRRFSAVWVRTVWLAADDYPTFIGMADLGLCLHQSSSGLDLPMKLAEFRGAAVPACAFDYAPVLGEVLVQGCEGWTFRNASELSDILISLAHGHVRPESPLAQARAWLASHPAERWDDHWRDTAQPVLAPQAPQAP